jgi:threonylcarbamoyladenosine tRNA methylthiotransferase MtaB
MLRLSSIDAAELDDQLFELVTKHDRIAPHLHLSLQHGDDLILKRMKRRHSRAQAIELCGRLKSARPDIALGADLIAGFPTEEEQHFANELSLIDECQLAYVHAFPYSPRPGTPAARMPQVDRAVIKQRAARLRQAGEAALRRHLDTWIGKEANVLVEREGFARLADFSTVLLGPLASSPANAGAGRRDAGGPKVRLRFTHHDGAHLHGVAA